MNAIITTQQAFSIDEVTEILTEATEIEQRLADARWRTTLIGTPVPLRTGLGTWEQMRLDQARLIREVVKVGLT